MPRYEHDPSAVSASITIFPKDSYEFKIGRPRAFERTAAAGHQSYGVRFPLTVVGGPQDGKKSVFSIYLHSEGGAQMGKRFQMAVAGFDVNEKNEKLFDEEVRGKDWSYDTTDGSVGEEWAAYEGAHVCCDVDVEIQERENKTTGEKEEVEQQVWGTWRPLEGATKAA